MTSALAFSIVAMFKPGLSQAPPSRMTGVGAAFIFAFVAPARGALRKLPAEADPGLVAALGGAFSVPVITYFTQPEWVSPQGISALAVLMGIVLLVSRGQVLHRVLPAQVAR